MSVDIDESKRCERCGWPYGAKHKDCRPGNCSTRPLPPLRPGRDERGGYHPADLAADLRRRASELRAQAAGLDVAADSVAVEVGDG